MMWPFARNQKPEDVSAIYAAPADPKLGSWRIEKDPHADKFDCQKYGIVPPNPLGCGYFHPNWWSYHTADSEQAARDWIAAEQRRPIIVEVMPVKGGAA